MQPEVPEVQVFETAEPEEHLPQAEPLWPLLLKVVLGVGAFLGVVALASAYLRPQLEAVSHGFLGRFGLLGAFLGAFLADAIHFPVPPQFYMLAVVTAGVPQAPALVAISAGSILGGARARRRAGRRPRRRFARRWFLHTEERIHGLFRRYGYWAVVVASAGPLAFSMLCNTAGFYRMKYRFLALFLILRVPRLLFFYALIRLGWARHS